MTKFFYDSEFLEDGETIDLISIAFVSEHGDEYYAVNADADWGRITKDPWLQKNVVQQLPNDETTWLRKDIIAKEVLKFLTQYGDKPDLYAWFSAYDHVAYAQLWGKMIHLPNGLPMFTHDVRSILERELPEEDAWELPKQGEGVHDALEDARHLKVRYEWIEKRKALRAAMPGEPLTQAELEALPAGSVVKFKYGGSVAVKGALGDWQVSGRAVSYESKALTNSKEGVFLICRASHLSPQLSL